MTTSKRHESPDSSASALLLLLLEVGSGGNGVLVSPVAFQNCPWDNEQIEIFPQELQPEDGLVSSHVLLTKQCQCGHYREQAGLPQQNFWPSSALQAESNRRCASLGNFETPVRL